MAFFKRTLATLALLLIPITGITDTYDFKNNLPPGCSQSGNNPAQCSGNLSLSWNDRIVDSSIDEVIVRGDVSLANANVYWQSNSRLTIRADGEITTGSNAKINANLFSDSKISIGYNAQLTGDSRASGDFITNSDVEIDGDVTADTINLSSRTKVTGDSRASGDFITNSNVTIIGVITADGDVSLASGNEVTGDIIGDTIFVKSTNSVVTGQVFATNRLILENNATINGDVEAAFILLSSSDARINGNAVSRGDIEIQWAGRISGDATAINIKNNSGSYNAVQGTPYCETSNGNQPLQCQSSQPSANRCDAITFLTDYGVVGASDFEFEDDATINGFPIRDSNNTGGNTPTPNGIVEQISTTFPELSPAAFPSFSSKDKPNNPTNLPPGDYDRIKLNGKNAFASTQGGTYRINSVEMKKEGATLQLAPGDYYIRELSMSENSTITVSPSGPVRLFIEDSFEADEDVSINRFGNVGDLQVYLYPDAEFEIDEADDQGPPNFNGIIYAPYSSTKIEIDEGNVIQGALLTAGTLELGEEVSLTYTEAIQQATNEALGCAEQVDEVNHYRIEHPTQLVSCVAAPVRVIACLDASCSSRYAEPVEVVLESSAPTSIFANSGINSFTGGQGVLGLSYVEGGSTTISLGSETPSAQNATECFDSAGSSPTDCTVEFRTAGIIFTANDGQSPIPSHFSGTDVDITARAVETNTTTGACEARVSGTQTLQLAASCRNPLTCQAGQRFAANTTTVPLNDAGSTLNYNNVSVNFDSNGNAPLTLSYTDVGALRLHGRLNLDSAANNQSPAIDDPAVTLTGTSINDFVIKPHTLRVTAVDENDRTVSATTSSGSALATAGENFRLIVSSQNANGNATPNFGRETSMAQVSVSYVQTLYPSTATAPDSDFVAPQTFVIDTNRVGSVRANDARWLDVGTIELAPALVGNSYLGAGDVAVKQTAAVGRFAPARFALSNSFAVNSCVAGDYTYMSEPGINVAYELYALDSDGNITENYDSAGYNDTAEVGVVAAHSAPTDTAADRFSDRLANLAPQQTWASGVLSFNATNATFMRHPDGRVDGPYANLQLGLQIVSELDSRNFATADLTLATLEGAAVPLDDLLQARFGRLVVGNTYGPEDEDLSVPLYAEYFDGQRFKLHRADSCTLANPTKLGVISDADGLSPTVAGSTTTLAEGTVPFNALRWQAVGSGTTGEFSYEYDAPNWLEFSWLDETGSVYQDPRATAGFGQYRGSTRVLFWKELR